MKAASPLFLTAVLAGVLRLAEPSLAQTTSVVGVPAKSRGESGASFLQPRAPVLGQPFDDREIELYLDGEARKLWATGRVPALRFERRMCVLDVVEPGREKLPLPIIAARAEAATLVLGEYSREPKKREPVFSVSGGAFVIGETGICITSLHVARETSARGFCAMTRDGRVFPVREVLAFEPVNDLAILQLDVPAGAKLPALPVALEPVPAGTPAFVVSHPDNRFYLLSTGHVARHTLWRTEAGEEAFMSITADFAKGSSGCPVLDERGAVIGIVNNTESVYYDDDGRKKQTDLQMVVKNATPSWAVRAMLDSTTKPTALTAP
jgi:S1-C subfamily serine protease